MMAVINTTTIINSLMAVFIIEFLRIKVKFSMLNCYAVTELCEEELQFEKNLKYFSIPSAYFKINMPVVARLI